MTTFCSLTVAGIAVLVLCSWFAGRWQLGTFGRDYVPMAPSTAWLMILFSSALFARGRWPGHRAAHVFGWLAAALVAAFSLLVLAKSRTTLAHTVEHWLSGSPMLPSGINVGRMSPITAITFLVAAAAMLAVLPPFGQGRWPRRVAVLLASGVTLTAMTMIAGYLMGQPVLYGAGFIPMALVAAVAFVLLGVAILSLAAPEMGPLRSLAGPHAGKSPRPSPKFGLAMLGILVMTILATGYLGFLYLNHLDVAARENIENDLNAVADLKLGRIAEWRRERLGDAELFASDSFVARSLRTCLADPPADGLVKDMAEWLAVFLRSHNYERVILLNAQLKPRLSVPDGTLEPCPTCLQLAGEVLRLRQVILSDLHLRSPAPADAAGRGGSGAAHLSLLAPIASPAGGGSAAGVALLEMDPRKFLFPLIESWPTTSRTAETLLVRREGDDVLYLHELRHQPGGAMSLRLPVSAKRLPAVMAARGQTGTVEGLDYRFAPVLAVLRQVPDTPWFMVVKMDRAEVFAPLRKHAWTVSAGMGLLILTACLGVALLWRRRDVHFLRRQLQTDQERIALAERVEHLMRNANDIILLADQNWNIVEANKRAVECYGYSPEEWQRVHMADLRASDSRTAFQRHTEQLLARGSAIYETVHRRKDRSTFPVEVSGRMIEVGGIHYRLVIIRDITERKRAEEAQARLVAAVEQAAESIMVTDTAGTIQYVNPAFERITGYTREEAVGKNPRILKSGVHDDAFYRKLWESLVRGETWSGRFMNKRKDGSLYEEEATLSPVRDAAGQIVNYVAVKRDVTREAQLETQLRQAQKMEAIGRLAGGVAHDFNNILMSILGNSDLALRRLAPGDRLHAYLEEIRLAGHRAADLTRQLLAFSRKQLFQPSVLDLNATLTNLQKMLRRLISEDIHLTLALAPDLGRTKADPGQIEQVIVNLAVNARDAMPRGGTLTLETANVELTEALLSHGEEIPPGRYVMLGVRDTGVGMTPEVKAHLFEPFFTTKPKGKGTGLGLSTVYGIVKQSGGYIEVESEPDQGAFFRVCLPRVDEAAEATGPGAAIGELRRGNETVLIAEDDDTVRHMTSAVLKECGYVVLTASRGAEALELARRHPGDIHLLLTDVVMPGMTGRDLSTALLNSRPGMKTIYMSGYTDTVLIGHDLDKPGVSFLQKPFTPETLTARVRAALDAGTAGPGA